MRKKKPRKSKRPGAQKPGRKTGKREFLRHAVASNILFSEIHPLTIRSVIPKLTFQTFRNGQTIFDESTRGRHLSMILRGRVRISKTTRAGLEPRLALLHEGDFFGELSIIDGLPRSARAEAVGVTEIALLPAAEFRQMITRSPQFASNLLLNMAIRLRTIDQTFVTELERNSTASQAQMDKLRQLIDASKIVNSTIDLDHLLELILDAARLSIRADRGTLYLLDEETQELRAKRVQGESDVEITLPLGKGLAGYVAKTGETVNIFDAYSDPRFNPEIDRRSGYRTRTVLCMPMRDKEGKILGVFQLLNKADGTFTSEDESFIAAYSVHASIALNNARLVRDLVQGERLAAVGGMASQIIHDIRSPMAALRLYAETIKRRSDDSGIGEIATHMIKQVDRFVRMAQEILDFSRGVSEMNIDTISVDELVDVGVELFSHEMQKRNIGFVRAVEHQGECRVDIEKMIRVFYNIASNAMDAMPDGGTLTQRVRRQGDALVIEFTDTGHGIPEEIRSKILQPFFTAGKKHGTGLGLAIAKKIVDDHRGELTILSETGKGTTIRISIPMDGGGTEKKKET
ncbi:MAG: ATP-binding protein [Ignavibacteria bacterium]|nr:ATP-binding protein [Ignavibacteria bacterium]